MKRKLFLIIAAICTSACASNVVPLGEGHYRITKLPTQEHKDQKTLQKQVRAEASNFCKKNKQQSTVQVVSLGDGWSSKFASGSQMNLLRVELEFWCK